MQFIPGIQRTIPPAFERHQATSRPEIQALDQVPQPGGAVQALRQRFRGGQRSGDFSSYLSRAHLFQDTRPLFCGPFSLHASFGLQLFVGRISDFLHRRPILQALPVLFMAVPFPFDPEHRDDCTETGVFNPGQSIHPLSDAPNPCHGTRSFTIDPIHADL